MQLIDNYQRRFKYLRLSITENCNFQCQYCLPEGASNSVTNKPHFLSLSEIDRVVSTFAQLGVEKIRITGGEPTLRKDFTDILSLIGCHQQIKTVALTTNGFRLLRDVEAWKLAGLNNLNVSVDSLSPATFKFITGQDRLSVILAGLDKAIAVGIEKVKVNTVLMKGLNDNLADYLSWLKTHPIELRFIELMETGQGSQIFNQYHLSGQILQQQLVQQGWQLATKEETSGPAQVYSHPDYYGKIGLIMPYSRDFCRSCNRLRISAKGKFHFCLFGEQGIELRDLLQSDSQQDELKTRIFNGLKIKPERHFLDEHRIGITQTLSAIGG
ncbi:GTP 3',8-cyclase MoaA [Utexia brackfieldae]|uniref:GTP 3',8-cyclase MoaA n=1 Tax=Utexia brackfieldae TaxID=3074108 RepID=UPI00370DC1A1